MVSQKQYNSEFVSYHIGIFIYKSFSIYSFSFSANDHVIPYELNIITSVIPRVYNITLRASDKYLTIFKSYQLSTQSIINFTLLSFPFFTNVIDDTGKFSLFNFLQNTCSFYFKTFKLKV